MDELDALQKRFIDLLLVSIADMAVELRSRNINDTETLSALTTVHELLLDIANVQG